MRSLTEAIEAAEARKSASFGGEEDQTSRLEPFNDFNIRATFSGFDLDLYELFEIVDRVSWFFTRQVPNVGVKPLFASAWLDGVLIGLMLGQQTLPHNSPAGDAPPPAGD